MYANSGPDLLILDITNPTQVQLVKRVANALFENEKSNEGNYLIGYGEKEIIEKYYINRGWDFQFGIQEDVQVSSSDNGSNRDGVGGSMARPLDVTLRRSRHTSCTTPMPQTQRTGSSR